MAESEEELKSILISVKEENEKASLKLRIQNTKIMTSVSLFMHSQSLQSCPTLCDPMDCSMPGFSVYGDSPCNNTGVGCHVHLQGIFLTWGRYKVNQPVSFISFMFPALASRYFTTSATWEVPSLRGK